MENTETMRVHTIETRLKIICVMLRIAKLESIFSGLFYSALSRATSIRSATDRSSSVIFFINLSRDRIDFLRGRKPDQPFKLIERRDEWNEHLLNNRIKFQGQSLVQILIASKTTMYSMEQLNGATARR